jgi:DNA-binding NarL/FixJ family response regulator
VIFVTSSQDRALNRRAYALGALACIPKPFRREAVVAMIQMALASRARPAPKA